MSIDQLNYSENRWGREKNACGLKNLFIMNIKDLGLEELTVSEKRETKGGLAPIVYIGLTIAGLFVCQSAGGQRVP